MADSRFKGTRTLRSRDVNELALLDEIKEAMKHSKNLTDAINEVAVRQGRTDQKFLWKIAINNGLK